MFPINIGAARISAGYQGVDLDVPPPTICSCPAPPPAFVRYGIGISFWEPARLAEVVRTPFCSPTLNGTNIGPAGNLFVHGTNAHDGEHAQNAVYHVHWLTFPVLQWLAMGFEAVACLKSETFDLGYMTELDPLWDDDQLSFLINPEAALFASRLAQLACVPDTAAASVLFFGVDALFWCSGSQGSVYPLAGTHANHIGGVDSSLVLLHRLVFKLHRQLVAYDTSTVAAMCSDVPQPILRKGQYKQQMMFPIPYTLNAFGFGVPSLLWAAGKEFPVSGEDYTYLVWRKRTCCAF
jgi:conjugal transfer pilus assembly protein TraU